MSNSKIAKIIVPIAMVAIVFGIWFVQNQETPSALPQGAGEGTSSEDQEAEALEYPLVIDSVDLTAMKAEGLPIILDFGADECVPCKEMEPVLVAVNADMQGKALVQFVDVWENTDAATGFPVQVIPTQLFINADGTPYEPSEGLGIEFLKYADKDTGEHIYTTHQGGLTEEQMYTILADMGVE